MNAPDRTDDWLALGEDWRAQPGSAIDVEALRQEVRRRGRRLRWAMANDLTGFVMAMGLCLWLLLSGRAVPTPLPALLIGLMVVLSGFQGWSLWSRRRQMGDSDLDAGAMVDLEIARARTSLRYWRVSVWLTVAIWLALYVLAMAGAWAPDANADPEMAQSLARAMVGAGSTGIGFAVWAWWLGRRIRSRLVRLRGLREELRDS